MSAPLLLGLDIGTTSCKCVLIDAAGSIAAETDEHYPVSAPRPTWSEQDPHDWWAAARMCIRKTLSSVHDSTGAHASGAAPATRIGAIGLAGQMHGLVLLDERGDVLRPAILWNDQRTAEQCERITQRVGFERVIQLTGNRLLTGFTAPKIEWVREHEPGIFARVRHFLLPKDYVVHRLSGAFSIDVSDASGTSLFDVGRRAWSDEMRAALDVPPAWLPAVAESPQVVARVGADAAAQTGLAVGTPVVAGAGDQAAQAIGMGIVEPGSMSITLGTSGVVFAPTASFKPDPLGRLHAFCHAAPDRWHVMGVMLAAGGSFHWICSTLGVEPGALAEEAAHVPPGAGGLLFLPYLSGERTPHADPLARGAFVGLNTRHGRAELARAVMEGVAFGLRDCMELIRASGDAPSLVRVSGGGAQSRAWLQILADVLGVSAVPVVASGGAAYGAALLAGIGVGVIRPADAAQRAANQVRPGAEPGVAAKRYAELYARYRALYPALRQEMHALAGMG